MGGWTASPKLSVRIKPFSGAFIVDFASKEKYLVPVTHAKFVL